MGAVFFFFPLSGAYTPTPFPEQISRRKSHFPRGNCSFGACLSGIFDQSWRCRRPSLAMFLVNTGESVDSDAFTFGLYSDLYAIAQLV